MISLLVTIVALVLVIYCLQLVLNLIPVEQPVRTIILVVVILIMVVWLLGGLPVSRPWVIR